METRKNIFSLFFIFGLAIFSAGIIKTIYILDSAGIYDISYFRTANLMLFSVFLISLHLILRFMKWHNILRNCNMLIPVKTSMFGFFSGLSLIFIPFLLGESILRSFIISKREKRGFNEIFNAVIADRAYDFFAILFWGIFFINNYSLSIIFLILFAGIIFIPAIKILIIRILIIFTGFFIRLLRVYNIKADKGILDTLQGKMMHRTMLLSIIAWSVPSLVLYLILAGQSTAGSLFLPSPGLLYASFSIFTGSIFNQMLFFSSAGMIRTGNYLINAITSLGVDYNHAVFTVFLYRLSTIGFSLITGIISLFLFRKSLFSRAAINHFEQIAGEYDIQLPRHSTDIVVERKIKRMLSVLPEGANLKGLDVGCGQGYYMQAFRECDRNICVFGIESSKNQVFKAIERTADKNPFVSGALPVLPFRENAFDFSYVINVLHHIPCRNAQVRAIEEMIRVTAKGGYIFINEINTTNLLFLIYMGYIFPILNNIDEGTEQWIKPDLLEQKFSRYIVDTRYYTFLPEFTPAFIWKALAPAEEFLERSSLKRYSAHYTCILQKQ